ncbi:hypothetical protein EPA93_16410 [Ktedonosporobacter rubrisoli]|uniref:non-specific serine/threonine protein kinase n=1 Tax=Ktedonosporobacter rubrisoli TaxID=2509675 RepID=A0A4P6JQ07_KTERU|nr:class IV lanthionine synthetase LanL [Ktedonosporobacter rubrisoli]QBD77487.1 hypothetical protein EPA93_16410 [Ktedonosporobacter rubrisoli]
MEDIFGTNSLATEIADPLARELYELCQSHRVRAQNWHIEYSDDSERMWVRFSREAAEIPAQGWKLHISANNASAKEVLQRVFPVLLTGATSFKVASSLRQLFRLNQGEGGISQVGKFITVYPGDDEEAVQLALQLDAVTQGLSGPRVPSDRALRPDSLIHYRYGNFSFRSYVQTPSGSIEAVLRTPDNQEVPDRRRPRYEPPEWVKDPFIEAGIAAELPVFERIINGRYLIVAMIFASINHIVYLGADLENGSSCIIKGPGYAWQNNLTDRSMHRRLLHEAHMLRELMPNPYIPRLFDVVEQNGDLFLVMEDIEGEDLALYVRQLLHQGQFVPLRQIIEWGIELAEVLESIHLKGMIYADIKPTNIIVGADRRLRFIDFELVYALDNTGGHISGRGTRGYMSPQQLDNLPLAFSDDIYGFGALLYFLVTGVDPAYAPNPSRLLERPLEWLCPEEIGPLRKIIGRCLQETVQARYHSMSEIKAALRAALESIETHGTVSQETVVNELNEEGRSEREHFGELSMAIMDTICAKAQTFLDGHSRAWISTHFLTYGLLPRDINTGNAGILLALAELVAEHKSACAAETLLQAARWLRDSQPIGKEPLPGLYVGESGVGAALLRAGQVLQDKQLIVAALEQGRMVASLPHNSPDLFNGTAGRLRFHLLLWDETKEREQLLAAQVCGEHLLSTAVEINEHEIFWLTPQGYGDLSGVAQPGYAHGVAGVADALLDLYEANENERLLPLITKAASWIVRQAIPAMEDKSGLSWPRVAGGSAHPSYWCHGGAGIGRFFLHLARHNLVSGAEEIAARAAYVVAHSTRWTGPTQCHGLAGNCEFLLDMYQATGDHRFLKEAFLFGHLLETFAQEQQGHIVFPADSPTVFTPDYMVGYAGIAMCLLRLSAPERLPHQLSRAGFRAYN